MQEIQPDLPPEEIRGGLITIFLQKCDQLELSPKGKAGKDGIGAGVTEMWNIPVELKRFFEDEDVDIPDDKNGENLGMKYLLGTLTEGEKGKLLLIFKEYVAKKYH